MGLHAHLCDGVPMAPIVGVGSFTGGDFWVESGGLLNLALREKIAAHPCVQGWGGGGLDMQGHPPSPGVVQHPGTTRSIAMGGRAMERDFFQCGGECCIARLYIRGGSGLWPWVLGCPMLALIPPVSAH